MRKKYDNSSYFTKAGRKNYQFDRLNTEQGSYSFALMPDFSAFQITSNDTENEKNNGFDYYKNIFVKQGIAESEITNSGEPKMHCGEPRSYGWGIVFEEKEQIIIALYSLEKEGLLLKPNRPEIHDEWQPDTINKYLIENKKSNRPLLRISKIYDEKKREGDERPHLNALINRYKNMGNKFAFFAQSKDRLITWNKLHMVLRPTLEKEILDHDDYLKIAIEVNNKRIETNKSHINGSIFGRLGITHSRLEQELNNYLNQLVQRNRITAQELQSIKAEQASKEIEFQTF